MGRLSPPLSLPSSRWCDALYRGQLGGGVGEAADNRRSPPVSMKTEKLLWALFLFSF